MVGTRVHLLVRKQGLNPSTTTTGPIATVSSPPLPRFQKLRRSAMRPAVLAALLVVAAAASPAAALYSAGSPVLQLDPNNFKSKVWLASRCPPPPPDRRLHVVLIFDRRGPF